MTRFDLHDDSHKDEIGTAIKNKEQFRNIPAGTHIVEASYLGEKFELSPHNVDRITGIAVNSTAEFIKNQEGNVTVVVPMMGSIPLVDRLIRQLGNSGFDLSRIDFRFAKKYKEDGKDIYTLDKGDKPLNEVRVMLDDIVDSSGSFAEIKKLLEEESGNGDLVCFTPGIKVAGDDGRPSTVELAESHGFSIGQITDGQRVNADINYVAELPNVWIDNAFGMNSGHADEIIKSINEQDTRLLEYVAETQVLERMSMVCLAGKPESFAEYARYMRALHKNKPNGYHETFQLLRQIESLHFTQPGFRGRQEAIEKMAMAREYFEGLKKVDYNLMALREDWRN